MSRTTKSLVTALVCFSAATFSHVVHGGTFTTGVFDDASDLGLTGLTPAQVSAFRAENSGPSTPSVTVGQINFVGPATTFPGGHTYASAAFGDSALNTLANSTYLFLASVGTPTDFKTISGLSLGIPYQLQLILYDGDSSTNSEEDRGLMTITAGSDTLSNFNVYNIISGTTGTTNASPGPGGFYNNRGAFLKYDFTATGPTLALTFTPPVGKYLVLSGFTLVPEPASASLLFMGGCALLGVRRFSKRRGGRQLGRTC